MAENTPPSILRDRLKKTKEINEFLENELSEICEFTMYEKQLLLVEKGCSELKDKNLHLSHEIENLTKVVQSRDDILNGVRNKIEEKKIRFSSLKDEASLLTTESSNEAVLSPSTLINEVLSTFESLSKYIGSVNIPYDARNADKLNITGEEVQNEVSKLRQILETSVEVEARRLSDSILIKEKLKSKAVLFDSKEIAIQTEPGKVTDLIWQTSSSNVNLLDISNFNDKRADSLLLSSNVEELERKLLDTSERCQVLSSANEDLEKLLKYKEVEIQELLERQNTPNSPCTCNKSTLDHDLEYKDMTLSCSVLPVVDSFQANMSFANNSFLPTIQEVKESSFEGSFEENNVPDFTSPPSDALNIAGEVDAEITLDVSREQGERALLENYRTELADLQKCRNLLANELEYCLSEIDDRDEQITLLQSTLPVAFNVRNGIAASSDLFKCCNEEIESLEILVDESEGSVTDELNAEVTGKLVNVLNIIQKGVDTLLAVSMYPSSDRSTESSFANMSSTTLSNMSSYPQQFCSIVLDSSVAVGANDSSMINPTVAFDKPDKLLKDVRNLRQSIELITSDFSREFFNVISKLDRVESIILWFRNMDAGEPVSSIDSTKPSKPTSLTTYKSVLIEDIREKARLILDLHKSRSDKQDKDSSQCVSAQCSDESLTKTYHQHNRDSGSIISTADSSVYASATDGDETHLHFMCRTDSKCYGEGQKSIVSSDVTLSTSVSAFDHCTEDSRRYDDPEVNMDQERCKDVTGAETILSAFWKTVNEFDEALENLGISTSKTVLLSDNDTLTVEKVECYKESVRQLLKLALLREPMFLPCIDEKDSYDPECTKLLSLDITSLNEDNQRKKPLQESLLTSNQNIVNVNEDEKENSFCDNEVALSKAVKNWKKLIHDSNKRIAELVLSKNNVEIKLSEKLADNHNLVQQLNKVQSEIKAHEEGLIEKNRIVEDLYTLIENKDVQLDNVKSEVSLVQMEATQLNVELKNTKESWNTKVTMVTDFMKQYQDLSVKIDSFQTEIDSLQKDKLELDSQLRSASTTIEELRTDLLNKEQLKTSLNIAEEHLAKEIAEKDDLKNNFQELVGKLSSADWKVSDLESEISSVNENLHVVTDQLSNAEKKVAELERQICSLNENMIEGDQLKSSLRIAEGKLANLLTEKEDLETNLQQVNDQLLLAQNKVIELEEAITNKTNLILELQASDIVHNDHQGLITHLESSVTTLTKELEDTRASWNTMILSSSSEIDQLKSALKTVEVHLSKELANKTKVGHTILDVEQKLFAAHTKVSDLEGEINAMNESLRTNELAKKENLQKNLQDVTSLLCTAENKVTELEEAMLVKNSLIQELQGSKMRENERQDLITSLERSVTTLTKTLEDTRASWSTLILSSSAEIDQLRSSLKTVEVSLFKELANKTELQNTLLGVEQKLLTAHGNVSHLESLIVSMNESSLEKNELRMSLGIAEDQLSKKMVETEELLNNLQDVTGKLSNAEKKILDLENEIASMDESLLEKDKLKTLLETAEEKLANELTEKEDLLNNFRDVTDRLSTAEKTVSDLEREVTAVSEKLVNTETAGMVVEERLAKELSEKEDLQSLLLNVTDRLATTEKEVADLEREIVFLKDKSIDEAQLRSSLKIAEDKLANDSAEKKVLQNNLEDVRNRLSSAENKVSDFETEINSMKESLLEKDQLKTLLETVEEKLINEFAEKEKLQKKLQDVSGQLCSAENKVTELEEALLVKNSLIHELQGSKMRENERQDLVANLEHSVTILTKTLEDTRAGWNDLIVTSSAEIDHLKSSLKIAEMQLAEELANKTELENSLHDIELRLLASEKRVADLSEETTTVKETLLDKVNFIQDLQAREIDQNEHLRSRIEELEEMVNTLTSALEETKMGWDDAIKSSISERAQLKASLKMVEEQLSNEMADKEKLASYSEEVSEELSMAKKEISSLERKLSDANQALTATKDQLRELEAGKKEIDEYSIRIRKLENCNNDLASSLQITRENWTNLMKTSRAEIDRLTALNGSLSYQLSNESLKCERLSVVLEDSSTRMINAEETIRDREVALDDLNVVLREKGDQISLLNSKYTCLSNNFQTLMLNCKESFRQHDQLLNRIELELATTSLEKENLSNLLEEALSRFDGLSHMLMEKEDNFKSALAEKEKLFNEKFSALDNLEGVVSDLRFDIMVAQDNRKLLILEANKCIDKMNTSKKRAEVQMMMEIVERKKLTSKLATAFLEMENLRGGLQMNQNIISDIRNSLSKLKNPMYDEEEALNRSDNFGDNEFIDTQVAGNDLKKIVQDTKERIAELSEAERTLSLKLDEEKASNIQLASELHKALSTIADLEEEIEKGRTLPSPANDIDNLHESSNSSENSALHSKSIPSHKHSVVSRGSLAYEDEFEATTYNATVHLEQSVFVSDFNQIMERTSLFSDNVDPLSMTMRPELVVTPRKMDTGHESTDDEFGTPVANRFWDGENVSHSPRQIRGTGEKTPVNNRSITASVTKNLAYQAMLEENADLQEKLKTNETDLLTLQSRVEETSAQHDQLSQRVITIEILVDDVMKVFYDHVPELSMEQNIVNISTDITKLTGAISKACGSTQNCLMDSVNMLISEGLPASSLIKDSIADTNSKMQVIAKDCSILKEEMLQFADLLASQLATTSSSISSSVKKNASSFNFQLAEKNGVIEELKDTIETLQSTLLAASLEKESLRDHLKEEIARNKSLKFSFEEKEKDLQIKYDILRDDRDANLFQRNNIESIILELLRQWNGDEEVISEDVVRELKFVFSQAVHGKNVLKVHNSKATNLNFVEGIEEIISKNELLEGSLSHLKLHLIKDCKTLSTGIKGIQNESKNLFLDFSSFKNEIEGTLCRALSAVNDLAEESLRNLNSKEDACVLEERLKKCQDRISDYETTIDEASSKCSSLASKLKLLEDNNSSLSSANEALVKGVSASDAKNKELFDKLEEIRASNGILSSEMAKLQETITGLNEKLRDNEIQLACEKQKVQEECSVCKRRESELEDIKQTLFSVVASTKGKPIDLSCSRDDVLGKLTYVKNVLSKSNDTLYSVLELLNSQEVSGVIALEHLYRQLKSNDIRDAYLCKKKIATEIHSMDTEMKVEELVQLSLMDLETKLVSVIMEKEAVVIADYQNDYECKLASKAHQLSQYEEKEKYMRAMIEDLTKENEKLEENMSKSQNVREDAGNTMGKDTPMAHLENTINQEENKMLTAEIDTLNAQISSLKNGAAEAASKFKVLVSDLEKILMNFLELLNVEVNVPSCHTNIELNLENIGFPNQLSSILQGIFSRLSDARKLFVSINKQSEENVLVVERLRDVENEHAKCKEVVLQMEKLCQELETKEDILSKLTEDHVNLQTQLNDLKRNIASKDNEVVSTLTTEKADLELELGQSRRQMEELNSRQAAFSIKSQNLKEKVSSVSSHVGSIKGEFITLQNETMAENKKILNYFHNLSKQLKGVFEDEKNKVGAFETEVVLLRGQLSALKQENSNLDNKVRNLETSLANESAEKQSLNEQLKKLEDAPARTGHEEKTCPYKEKVQELKKELWIIRQKTGEEQSHFNVMKKNIEEDLAFKAAVIKKLEERNEATVTQFTLRLASSTTSYNQVCKKLEEAEEKISFLRDMNSQDKKRLEKDIDNLSKEISRLQFVKTFVDGLGINCDKLKESLPEIKKKLLEYENLQTALNEMTDKNKELEEECDFMNKQIEFLELRNAEMFKQNMEVTEQLEMLKKELADNVELALKSKQLQEGIDSMKVSESRYIAALDASHLQLNESLQRLSELELKNNQLQNAYKLLESNLESRNQKILHYVSEMKNYESMLTEKTKMNQEVGLALAEERSKYADLALQKSSVEKDLASLQNELRECHARLKDLGSRLDIAASVENDLRKLSAEHDDITRNYNDLKSNQAVAQQVIHERDSLIQSLRSTHKTLLAEKNENEGIFKAKERELIAEIDSLKTEATNNAVRIVQLESILETSQTVQVESYKNKISSLEIEVETLKKELSRSPAVMSPRPQHVTVEAASLSNKLDTRTRVEFEHAINKLEKKQTVLKRLCQQRRERILEMENLLRQHDIHVPGSTNQSH